MVMFLYSCIFQFFQWAYIAIMLIKTMTIFRVGKSFIVIKITLYKSLIPYGVSFLLLPAHLPFPSFSIRRAFSVSFYTLGLNMDALALAKRVSFLSPNFIFTEKKSGISVRFVKGDKGMGKILYLATLCRGLRS